MTVKTQQAIMTTAVGESVASEIYWSAQQPLEADTTIKPKNKSGISGFLSGKSDATVSLSHSKSLQNRYPFKSHFMRYFQAATARELI